LSDDNTEDHRDVIIPNAKNMKYRSGIRCQRWGHTLRTLLPRCAVLLALALRITTSISAADFYPLPPWYFYGGGNGSTWDGSSTTPDNAQLSVTVSPPPTANQYGTAVATSSSDLLQITPLTTYALTLSATLSGPGSAYIIMIDSVGVVSTTPISGSTWKRYTNSFTTGTPDDPLVGRNLNVQLQLNRFSTQGTTTASFTNVQFQVSMARPTLEYRLPAPEKLQLLWPTNFYWYIPEHTADMQTGPWEAVTNSPVTSGDRFLIELGLETGPHFFRLRQP
jgi:hypothetical protein